MNTGEEAHPDIPLIKYARSCGVTSNHKIMQSSLSSAIISSSASIRYLRKLATSFPKVDDGSEYIYSALRDAKQNIKENIYQIVYISAGCSHRISSTAMKT